MCRECVSQNHHQQHHRGPPSRSLRVKEKSLREEILFAVLFPSRSWVAAAWMGLEMEPLMGLFFWLTAHQPHINMDLAFIIFSFFFFSCSMSEFSLWCDSTMAKSIVLFVANMGGAKKRCWDSQGKVKPRPPRRRQQRGVLDILCHAGTGTYNDLSVCLGWDGM